MLAMVHIDGSGCSKSGYCVRDAVPDDVSPLLQLMRQLAIFEDYINDFAVTEAAVLKHGFGDERLFSAFVAEPCFVDPATKSPALVGMAITYVVPWTYSMRPRVVLKELYVDPGVRGYGIGTSLMKRVIQYAEDIDADQLNWTVMNGNLKAEQFYSALGGRFDSKWNNWVRPVEMPADATD